MNTSRKSLALRREHVGRTCDFVKWRRSAAGFGAGDNDRELGEITAMRNAVIEHKHLSDRAAKELRDLVDLAAIKEHNALDEYNRQNMRLDEVLSQSYLGSNHSYVREKAINSLFLQDIIDMAWDYTAEDRVFDTVMTNLNAITDRNLEQALSYLVSFSLGENEPDKYLNALEVLFGDTVRLLARPDQVISAAEALYIDERIVNARRVVVQGLSYMVHEQIDKENKYQAASPKKRLTMTDPGDLGEVVSVILGVDITYD